MKKKIIILLLFLTIVVMSLQATYAVKMLEDPYENIQLNNCELGLCFEDGGGSGPGLTTAQKVQQAANNLNFDSIVNTDNKLNFMSVWIYDVTITWQSNRQNIISNTGVINRTNVNPIEVTVKAIFKLENYTQSKDYVFYVLPKSDLSDETLPLSTQWFNTLNYSESVGTVYDDGLEHRIYVDSDYSSASRLQVSNLNEYSPSSELKYIRKYESSWGTTTSLNLSLQTQLAVSANSFFVGIEPITLSEFYGEFTPAPTSIIMLF